MKVVLAADSGKCTDALLRMGIEASVVNPNMDETLVTGKRLPPMEVARALAAQKAVTVLKYYPSSTVLGLDTVICLEGELFGYPKNRDDAKRMLMRLSGKVHEVHTGVHLVSDYIQIAFSAKTTVQMTAYTEAEIDAYLSSTEEYLTCPGAYDIGGFASVFVERVNGDINSCRGLPVCELRRQLRSHGIRI